MLKTVQILQLCTQHPPGAVLRIARSSLGIDKDTMEVVSTDETPLLCRVLASLNRVLVRANGVNGQSMTAEEKRAIEKECLLLQRLTILGLDTRFY